MLSIANISSQFDGNMPLHACEQHIGKRLAFSADHVAQDAWHEMAAEPGPLAAQAQEPLERRIIELEAGLAAARLSDAAPATPQGGAADAAEVAQLRCLSITACCLRCHLNVHVQLLQFSARAPAGGEQEVEAFRHPSPKQL